MLRSLTVCLAALLATAPAFAQSVTVTETAPQVRPLSPSLGETESLAIITPAQADALIQVPTAPAAPASGEVSASLGETESFAIVTPAQADAVIESGPLSDDAELSILDTLPRITPAQAATIEIGTATLDRSDPLAEEETTIYVVEDGMILPSGTWSAQDSAACKASGGIELPLPGGRTGCFKL